jgi:hypothetical protein
LTWINAVRRRFLKLRQSQGVMMTMSGRGRTGIFARVVEWWHDLRAGFARFDELHNCGPEVGNIVRDVGLSTTEFYTIAAKRPDAADQLKLRLEALNLDRAAMLRADPGVMRDLERVCTVCGSKRQCRRDWLCHPDDEVCRTYCPNASTLQALAGPGEVAH